MIKTATISSPGRGLLKSAKGTLWGVVNGVTYYADHSRGFSTTSQESRLTASWFGAGNSLKYRMGRRRCGADGSNSKELVAVG